MPSENPRDSACFRKSPLILSQSPAQKFGSLQRSRKGKEEMASERGFTRAKDTHALKVEIGVLHKRDVLKIINRCMIGSIKFVGG